MNRTARIRSLLLSLTAALGSCEGEGGGGSNPPPIVDAGVEVSTPSPAPNTPVTVGYTLTNSQGDPLSIKVEYSPNGGLDFLPATPMPGQETAGLAASSQGSPQTFQWNSKIDGVGLNGPNPNVQLRITATGDAPGSPATTSSFTVSNFPNNKPSVIYPTFPFNATSSPGMVAVRYWLVDAESDVCRLTKMKYSMDNGATFLDATPGPGGDGTANLVSGNDSTSTSAANYHTFVWNAFADWGASPPTGMTFRIIASDGYESDPPDGLPGFTLDNSWLASGSKVWSPAKTEDPTPTNDEPVAVATDGRSLFVLGRAGEPEASSRWALYRYDLLTGSKTVGFASDLASSHTGRAAAVAVNANWIFLAGIENVGTTYCWRIEKRAIATGELAASLTVTPPVGAPAGYAGSIAADLSHMHVLVDDRFLYVVGTELVDAANRVFTLRMEKRKLSDLSLSSSFGTDGRVLGPGLQSGSPVPHMHEAFSIASDGSYVYIAGREKSSESAEPDGGGTLRIEKRRLSDGAPDPQFGNSGILSFVPMEGPGRSVTIALKDSTLYAHEYVKTGEYKYNWKFEKRNAASGALEGALLVSDAEADSPYSRAALVVTDEHLYVAGREKMPGTDTSWRVERRQLVNFALATGFGPDPINGVNGILRINPGTGEDFPTAMTMAAGVLYVVGTRYTTGNRHWWMEARLR